jgi:hypothetical protein
MNNERHSSGMNKNNKLKLGLVKDITTLLKNKKNNTFNISLIALAKAGLTSAGCKAPLA